MLALLGYNSGTVECTDPGVAVAQADSKTLTCGDVQRAEDYVELLAGRPVTRGMAEGLQRGLAASFKADPAQTARRLDRADAVVKDLKVARGLQAAEKRSTLLWNTLYGDAAVFDGAVHSTLDQHVAVWGRDDEQKLVLTEMDIEGWIFYASLCREVQSGGAITMSVGSRVGIYNDVRERFDYAGRDEQIAMTAMGPFWAGVKVAWADASYERQQAWVAAAPLPPPMNATSMGYLGSVLESDLARHAHVLHEQLGPLSLGSP